MLLLSYIVQCCSGTTDSLFTEFTGSCVSAPPAIRCCVFFVTVCHNRVRNVVFGLRIAWSVLELLRLGLIGKDALLLAQHIAPFLEFCVLVEQLERFDAAGKVLRAKAVLSNCWDGKHSIRKQIYASLPKVIVQKSND